MNSVSGELTPSVETKPRKKGSWPLSRWLLLIALVFAAHVALIFVFGEYKPVPAHIASNVSELQLAAGSNEWLVLNNPTLFAQPNLPGFAGRALEPLHVVFHQQDWTEPPRWLPLPVKELGAIFSRFMQTNRFASFRLESRPPPQFSAPLVLVEPEFAKTSTLRIKGLAGRTLLTPIKPPSWPHAGVIAPSKVQALVNAAGDVVSVVLLSSSGDAAADQRALELARAARFTSASGLSFGRLIFNWHTVLPPATNAPPGL